MEKKIYPFDISKKKNRAKKIPYPEGNVSFVNDPAAERDIYGEDAVFDESFEIDPFFRAMEMSQEEKDAFMNTGAFNAYISGYLLLAMKECGFSVEEIKKTEATLQGKVFDEYTAKMARTASEKM